MESTTTTTTVTSASFEALPVEILCKEVDYLEPSERQDVSHVCKRWRRALLESYYLKDMVVKASNGLFLSPRPSTATSTPTASSPTPLSPTFASFRAANNKSNSNKKAIKHHSATTSMALATYSVANDQGAAAAASARFDPHFISNVVHMEFENDTADAALFAQTLKSAHIDALPRMRTLSFVKTSMSSRTLGDLLTAASYLHTLHLVQCDGLFMTGFLMSQQQPFAMRSLVELSLSKNRYLTDHSFNLLVNAAAPALARLDISFCNLTKTNYKSVSSSLLQAAGTTSSTASTVVFTVENLIKQLNNNGGGGQVDLRSLDLSGIELFNHDEVSLLALGDATPRLEELRVAQLANLRVDTLGRLVAKLPALTLIDLNASCQFDLTKATGRSVSIEQCLSLTRLRVLNMRKSIVCDAVRLSRQLVDFAATLTHLDLSCATFVSASDQRLGPLEFARSIGQCERLEHLSLAYCDQLVTDAFVTHVSERLGGRLAHLDVRNCTQLSDAALHSIARHLVRLVHLDVSWCHNLTDYGLDATLANDVQMHIAHAINKELNASIREYAKQPFLMMRRRNEIAQLVHKTRQMNEEKEKETETEATENKQDEEEEEEKTKPVSLRNLKRLRVLRMESCRNVSDMGLLSGVDVSQLRELDVKLCTGLAGSFLFASAVNELSNFKLFPHMRTFNVSQCTRFSEESLLLLVENAPRLRELAVSSVQAVTSRLCEALMRERRALTRLDVSFCPSVSERAVDAYEQFLYASEFASSRDFHIDKRFISKNAD